MKARLFTLFLLLSSFAHSMSFDHVGGQLGIGARYSSFSHPEGQLVYDVSEQVQAAITYTPSRSLQYGFGFGYSNNVFGAEGDSIGETQTLISLSLFIDRRIPLTRSIDAWVGVGFGSNLRSHKERYSLSDDGYLDQEFEEIPLQYSETIGLLRTSVQSDRFLGVDLPFGIGLFGVYEQGFSERTSAAAIGAMLLLNK